jgi:distribution and morphology protein 10
MYLRRRKPTQLVKIQAVSDATLPNGGTVLATVHNDYGKWSSEFLYSTDSALIGLRGLYNFGTDPRLGSIAERPVSPEHEQAGLFSLGSELYYGALNKSFGLSTGLRFTTLPSYTGFPYTMTLTLNPLMGNLSSTYSVKAGPHLALSSRFDFNFYSYESGVMAGLELWRMRGHTSEDLEWARKKIANTPGWFSEQRSMLAEKAQVSQADVASPVVPDNDAAGPMPSPFRVVEPNEDVTGVLKARVDQNWRIGLLWEGRFKELLFTIGANIDLKRREQIFRGVGLEVQYSS